MFRDSQGKETLFYEMDQVVWCRARRYEHGRLGSSGFLLQYSKRLRCREELRLCIDLPTRVL